MSDRTDIVNDMGKALEADLKLLSAADPAPQLGGAARNAIVEAALDEVLLRDLKAIAATDATPELGLSAKQAIIEAAFNNLDEASPVTSIGQPSLSSLRSFVATLNARLTGGIEILLKPAAAGALALAAVAGVGVGSVMSAAAYEELSPEEELANHYDVSFYLANYYDPETDDEGT